LLGCSVNNSGKTVTRKTDNPNLPIVYKNGFKDFTIKALLTIQDNDTTYINELRFNAVESALYTQKLMYDRFGKWSNEINQANYTYPTLVWENVMLFDNENKRYTVAANGTESYENMFAAVMVYDADNNDCLSPNSPEKEKIISYFSKGIKNLSKSEKFYVLFQQKFGVK
jgi:hypothetical protein